MKKFDEILDVATGPNAEPYSFLTIHTGAKTFKKTFMLRFEAYLEPESDSERFFFCFSYGDITVAIESRLNL